jgi:transketolase C-terminal domain/subunit
MTNEGAVVLMIVGAILGAGAYLHNIWAFKKRAWNVAKQSLAQGKNTVWSKMLSVKTGVALGLMSILWFADSSE